MMRRLHRIESGLGKVFVNESSYSISVGMELADAYLLINWELLEYFKGYIACRVVVVVDTGIDIH